MNPVTESNTNKRSRPHSSPPPGSSFPIWTVLGVDALASLILEWCDDFDVEAVTSVDRNTWSRVTHWRLRILSRYKPTTHKHDRKRHRHNKPTTLQQNRNNSVNDSDLKTDNTRLPSLPRPRPRTSLACYLYKRCFYVTPRLCHRLEKFQRNSIRRYPRLWPWEPPFIVRHVFWNDSCTPPMSLARLFPQLETLDFSEWIESPPPAPAVFPHGPSESESDSDDEIDSEPQPEPDEKAVTLLILPSTLRKIVFGNRFLPSQLNISTHAHTSTTSTSKLQDDDIPRDSSMSPCLESLSFGPRFNAPLSNLLCCTSSLRELRFPDGASFSHSLSNYCMDSLTTLDFGRPFAATRQAEMWNIIKKQAHTLQHLSIALLVPSTQIHLSHPCSHAHTNTPQFKCIPWPAGLLTLTLDVIQPHECIGVDEIDREIDLDEEYALDIQSLSDLGFRLPDTLRTLRTAFEMNIPFGTLQFPSLTCLEFGSRFDQPVSSLVLPSTLRRLAFGSVFNQSLTELVFPPSLTELDFAYDFGVDVPFIEFKQPFDQLRLPPTLVKLHFDAEDAQPIHTLQLPQQLQEITFGEIFNQPLESLSFCLLPTAPSESHAHPTSVTPSTVSLCSKLIPQATSALAKISLGRSFNQPVSNWCPPSSLRILHFGEKFNQPVDNLRLPETLQELEFGACFNQSLARFPVEHLQRLKSLVCGGIRRYPITELSNRLPDSLTYLHHAMVRGDLSVMSFPHSLQHLALASYLDPLSPSCVTFPASLIQLTLHRSYDMSKITIPVFPESSIRVIRHQRKYF